MNSCLLFCVLIPVILGAPPPPAQPAQRAVAQDQASPVPEMSRLAKVLAGDWETTETIEKGEFFPNPGERRGSVHASLAAGGTTLIYEVHSGGSAGKLDGMLVIWWDRHANSYRFFICFNNPEHPCKMRGTAHWEGDLFVNDYDEMVKGKKTAWRDSFSFTSTSHTLLAAMKANGRWQTLITTKGDSALIAEVGRRLLSKTLTNFLSWCGRSIVSWNRNGSDSCLLDRRPAPNARLLGRQALGTVHD